ncbi:cyclodeaminase/cyclohydrolase family protein [Xiamenia xianingshaonis]|uniref:Cyclodeaminase/cyclohydrolase family protein n=1 Tax=Xiamenia xianingshaonis TaxID=2682776 RepID=A0A9E6MQ90_9ACTN|nr:cyclodeaminase/cyclohydrolase family protein [Xiamenia xianingshaonis]NHM13885.1 sugar ABC transporter substrate-binding protein [Xiamenia xianingshaonis]QTU84423.1 cyclodeaminase/cyclohydrolase family protein [Xiamenia xianingshaonis]
MDVQFIEDLASSAPTPGGGGACACVGVLASALASMVGNLTVGKAAYAQVEADVYVVLEKLAALRGRLLELVDEDARAFAPLAAAYKMPKATDAERAAKNAALQEALVGACDVPYEIMETVGRVVRHIDFLAANGSRMALSDVGAAAAFARAAADGASLNIFINAASLDDEAQAQRYRDAAEALAGRIRVKCDEIFAFVKDQVA